MLSGVRRGSLGSKGTALDEAAAAIGIGRTSGSAPPLRLARAKITDVNKLSPRGTPQDAQSVRHALVGDQPSNGREQSSEFGTSRTSMLPPAPGAQSKADPFEDFSGVWISKKDGEYRGCIENGKIVWAEDGSESTLKRAGRNAISMKVDGSSYSAVLSDDLNLLRWCDGDLWARSDPQSELLRRLCLSTVAPPERGGDTDAPRVPRWSRWHANILLPQRVQPPLRRSTSLTPSYISETVTYESGSDLMEYEGSEFDIHDSDAETSDR